MESQEGVARGGSWLCGYDRLSHEDLWRLVDRQRGMLAREFEISVAAVLDDEGLDRLMADRPRTLEGIRRLMHSSVSDTHAADAMLFALTTGRTIGRRGWAKHVRAAAKEGKPTKRVTPVIDPFYSSWEWRTLRARVLEFYGSQCMCCGAQPGGGSGVSVNVDHIRSRRYFPALALEFTNCAVLCAPCNHGKGNRTVDWRPKWAQHATEAEIRANSPRMTA